MHPGIWIVFLPPWEETTASVRRANGTPGREFETSQEPCRAKSTYCKHAGN